MVLKAVQETTKNLRGIHKILEDSRSPFRKIKTTDTHNSITNFFLSTYDRFNRIGLANTLIYPLNGFLKPECDN